jgi:AAA15 family ATPase/GTPase
LPCKKLNVFIGEPNSGKSNIIEALCLQSQNAISSELNHQMFRYKTIGDLFHDFNINSPIHIITDDKLTILGYAIRDNGAPENQFHFLLDSEKEKTQPTQISHDGKVAISGNLSSTNVHFYEFKRLLSFINNYVPHLSVPYGENLPSLLLSNPEYKKWVSDFLKAKGLTLNLKPTENDIIVSKFVNDDIYSYPYFTLSETLQRIIFYTIAIKSNKDNVILLDEPESNTFPLYTKLLAERIALDKTNQFFLTTHNPYLLLNLIEKSKQEDINVIIARMENYQTKLTVLKSDQIAEVLNLNSDVFFNFDKVLDL